MCTSTSVLLGRNVRNKRLGAGLNKVSFCMMANISRPILNRIERGEGNVTLDTLVRMANALEVTPKDLLS